MTDPEELVYSLETHPPGCVCFACGTPFEDGERYSQRLAFLADGVTFVEAVCLRCALAPLEDAA